jgi:hypothetical protein
MCVCVQRNIWYGSFHFNHMLIESSGTNNTDQITVLWWYILTYRYFGQLRSLIVAPFWDIHCSSFSHWWCFIIWQNVEWLCVCACLRAAYYITVMLGNSDTSLECQCWSIQKRSDILITYYFLMLHELQILLCIKCMQRWRLLVVTYLKTLNETFKYWALLLQQTQMFLSTLTAKYNKTSVHHFHWRSRERERVMDTRKWYMRGHNTK